MEIARTRTCEMSKCQLFKFVMQSIEGFDGQYSIMGLMVLSPSYPPLVVTNVSHIWCKMCNNCDSLLMKIPTTSSTFVLFSHLRAFRTHLRYSLYSCSVLFRINYMFLLCVLKGGIPRGFWKKKLSMLG
jgi:hypothetical protein